MIEDKIWEVNPNQNIIGSDEVGRGCFAGPISAASVKINYSHINPVSYTHLRAHETGRNLVCRLLLEKKKKPNATLYVNRVSL